MSSFVLYITAATAEIAGCFAFWTWLRLDKSVYWTLPGLLALVVFAVLLTRIDVAFAGRAYAAYGGVYIAASLVIGGGLSRRVGPGFPILGKSHHQ